MPRSNPNLIPTTMYKYKGTPIATTLQPIQLQTHFDIVAPKFGPQNQ